MNTNTGQIITKSITAVGFILSVALCIYGWRAGIFSSQEKLQGFIAGFGVSGALVFIVIQIVQVIVPVLPGGLSCLAGVLMFGAWQGFFYNYIGLCIGSVLAFLVAKYFGKPILNCFFSKKLIDKYEHWTSEKNRFAKLFFVAIFLPGLPDDFLCFLAGITEMTLSKFTVLILIGKIFPVALYSLGIMEALTRIPALAGW